LGGVTEQPEGLDIERGNIEQPEGLDIERGSIEQPEGLDIERGNTEQPEELGFAAGMCLLYHIFVNMGKKLKDGQSEVRVARLHTVRNASNSGPIEKETKRKLKRNESNVVK
jgi:hypothetical protein